ncbi:hypothetical protein ES705_47001 [subsurface metagenome]
MSSLLTNDTIARGSCQAELKQAWGDWVSQLYPWQWFVTLTFRDRSAEQVRQGWTKVGMAYAKTAYNQFLGRLQPALGPLYWFRAFETQFWRGVPHIHVLVGGLDSLEYAPVAAWYWQRYGFIRVLEYDPQLGAGYYLCKYVVKELGDIRFSPSLTSLKQTSMLE